jgi:hypothetical protein
VQQLAEIHATIETVHDQAGGTIRRWLDEHHTAYTTAQTVDDLATATDRLARHLRLAATAPPPCEFAQQLLFGGAQPAPITRN